MVMNITTCASYLSQVRQAGDVKYLTAAEKMANSYNRKQCVKSFGVVDKVSVWISRIDRILKLPWVTMCIVEVLGGVQGVYRLQ